MKFVSDCLTGKDNLTSDWIVRFTYAALTKWPFRQAKIRARFH
jgi:hypothetical protein